MVASVASYRSCLAAVWSGVLYFKAQSGEIALVVYLLEGATMATTITLEPQNIEASVQSLKTEFAKANMPGV